MKFLRRFFGRDDKFYDLLESSAEEANNASSILKNVLPHVNDEAALQEANDALGHTRRKHKGISMAITTELCKTFVTPLEREDIEAIASSLSRITKTVEKIGERLVFCPPTVDAERITRQLVMLEQATGTVLQMIRTLRKNPHVEQIQDDYSLLQHIEGDADKFMISLLRELFLGDTISKDVIFLKDIYELLEKAIDRCRDAGKIVFQIVLKYS